MSLISTATAFRSSPTARIPITSTSFTASGSVAAQIWPSPARLEFTLRNGVLAHGFRHSPANRTWPRARLFRFSKVETPTAHACLQERGIAQCLFVTSKEGTVGQYRLEADGSSAIRGDLVRTLMLGSIAEGCVADVDLGWVYIAAEDVGIWKI